MINSFDAIICLNGRISKKINNFIKSQIIIAADGAFNKLLKLNIIPHLVIGDFDSIKNVDKCNYSSTEFIFDPDQDTNDFEKILIYCKLNNLKNLLVFGLNGGQLEHILNNISVLKKFYKDLNLFIYDRNRLGIFVNKDYELNCKRNEIISIIPLPKAKIKTENLKWELSEEYLELGVREGARNLSQATRVNLEVSEGVILLFFDNNL